MASNNRKQPQHSFGPKGGGGRKGNFPSSQHNKSISFSNEGRETRKTVMHQLEELFTGVFERNVIEYVAEMCQWDLNKSIDLLFVISPEAGAIKENEKIPKKSNLNAANKAEKDQGVQLKKKFSTVPQRRINSKTNDFGKLSVNANNAAKNVNRNKAFGSQFSSNISTMMNAGQAGSIKVSYRKACSASKADDDEDEDDDDDADVVIEEENEVEVAGSDDAAGPFPFSGNSYSSLYQFQSPSASLTPMIPVQKISHIKTPDSSAQSTPKSGTNDASKFNKRSKTANKTGQIPDSKGISSIHQPSTSLQSKVKPESLVERIKKLIFKGYKVMVLMRGCPGSGKSYLAEQIIKATVEGDCSKYVFSTDNYFVQIGGGRYVYLPERLPEAHYWNQCCVLNEARHGTNPLIIDNCNLEVWEMKAYAEIAVKYGYSLELLEPDTPWRYNAAELARRNAHNVPRRKIQDMLSRFKHDLNAGKLLALLKLKYSPSSKPPQPAAKPPSSKKVIDSAAAKKVTKRTRTRKRKTLNPHSLTVNSANKALSQLMRDFSSSQVSDLSTGNSEMSTLYKGKGFVSGKQELKGMSFPVEIIENSQFFTKDLQKEINEREYTRKYPTAVENIGFPVVELSDTSVSGDDDVDGDSYDSSYCSEDILRMQLVQMPSEEEEEWEDQSDQGSKTFDDDMNDFHVQTEKTPYHELEAQSCVALVKDGDETQSQNGHINSCWEYVLVLEDGTLVPQKSYTKEDTKENPVPGLPSRCWEYLLIADGPELQFSAENKRNKVNVESPEEMVSDVRSGEYIDQRNRGAVHTSTDNECQNIVSIENNNNNPMKMESSISNNVVSNNSILVASSDIEPSKLQDRAVEAKDISQSLDDKASRDHIISEEEMDRWLNTLDHKHKISGSWSAPEQNNKSSLQASSGTNNMEVTEKFKFCMERHAVEVRGIGNIEPLGMQGMLQSVAKDLNGKNKSNTAVNEFAQILESKRNSNTPLSSSSFLLKSKPLSVTERVKNCILQGHKVMVLMRGCPGSGKSYLAKGIIKSTVGGDFNKYVFSTDNYFVQLGHGQFTFFPEKLQEAHYWNQCNVLNAARNRINPIIVDNTNLELWEMKAYAEIAVKYGYKLELLQPNTSWRYNAAELARKNVHNISQRKIQNMLDRFERNLTGDKVLALLNLKYSPSTRPPQPAAEPPPSLKSVSKNKRTRKRKKKSSKTHMVNVNESGNGIKQMSFEMFKSVLSKQGKFHKDLQKIEIAGVPSKVENSQFLNRALLNETTERASITECQSGSLSEISTNFFMNDDVNAFGGEDSSDNMYSSDDLEEGSVGQMSTEEEEEEMEELTGEETKDEYDDRREEETSEQKGAEGDMQSSEAHNINDRTLEGLQVLHKLCAKSDNIETDQISLTQHWEQCATAISEGQLKNITNNETMTDLKFSVGDENSSLLLSPDENESKECKNLSGHKDSCNLATSQGFVLQNSQGMIKDSCNENEVASPVSDQSEGVQNSLANCSIMALCSDIDMSEEGDKSRERRAEKDKREDKEAETKPKFQLPEISDPAKRHVISDEQINRWLSAVDPCYEMSCLPEQKENSFSAISSHMENEINASMMEISEGNEFLTKGKELDGNENISPTSESKKFKSTFPTPDLLEQMEWMSTFERIPKLIYNGFKVMVLLRGCPGSGKSNLARDIIKASVGGDLKKFVFSTDDYFVQLGGGLFTFVPEKLPEAHNWNQCCVLSAAMNDINPIIVDNINLELWEMKPYAEIAVKYGYIFMLLEPNTPWRYNSCMLAQKNVHNVPRQRIEEMLDRFDHTLNGDKVLDLLKLRNSVSEEPQQCSILSSSLEEVYDSEDDKNLAEGNRQRSRKIPPDPDSTKKDAQYALRGQDFDNSNIYTSLGPRDEKSTSELLQNAGKLQFPSKIPILVQELQSEREGTEVTHSELDPIEAVASGMCNISAVVEDDNDSCGIYFSDDSILELEILEKPNEEEENLRDKDVKEKGKIDIDIVSCSYDEESSKLEEVRKKVNNELSLGTHNFSERDNILVQQNDVSIPQKLFSREDLSTAKQTIQKGSGKCLDTCSENLKDTGNEAFSDSSKEMAKNSLNLNIVEYDNVMGSDQLLNKQETSLFCTEVSSQNASDSNSLGMDSCDEMELVSLIVGETNERQSLIAKHSVAMISSKIEAFEDVSKLEVIKMEAKPSLQTITNIDLTTDTVSGSIGDCSEVEETMANKICGKYNFLAEERSSEFSIPSKQTALEEIIENNKYVTASELEIKFSGEEQENASMLVNPFQFTINDINCNVGIGNKPKINYDSHGVVENGSLSVLKSTVQNEKEGKPEHTPGNDKCADSDLLTDVDLTNSLCHDASSTNVNNSAHVNSAEGAAKDRVSSEKCVSESKQSILGNASINQLLDVTISDAEHPSTMGDDFDSTSGGSSVALDLNKSSLELKINSVSQHNFQDLRIEDTSSREECKSYIPKVDLENICHMFGMNVPDVAGFCLKVTDAQDYNSMEEDFENASENSMVTSTIEKSDVESSQEASFRTTNILNVFENKIHDTTSAEEDYESAVSSELSDDEEVRVRNALTVKNNSGNLQNAPANSEQFGEDEQPKADLVLLLDNKINCASVLNTSGGGDNSEHFQSSECPSNMESTPSVRQSESTEILRMWEEGKMWDDSEAHEHKSLKKSHKETYEAVPIPKPAREHRNKAEVRSCGEKVTFPFGESVANDAVESVPPEVQKWSTVAEPVASWEEESDDGIKRNVVSHVSDVPQPQRSLFADNVLKSDVDTMGNQQSQLLSITVDLIDSETCNNKNDMESMFPLSVNEKGESSTYQAAACCIDIGPKSLSERVTSSTNTHHSDFLVLQNVNNGSEVDPRSGMTVRYTFSRNIAEFIKSSPPKIPQLLMLDKSSMTSSDYEHISVLNPDDAERQYEQLAHMFPHISRDELRGLYESCQKDVNWTVDLLLESEREGVELSSRHISDNLNSSSLSDLLQSSSLSGSNLSNEDLLSNCVTSHSDVRIGHEGNPISPHSPSLEAIPNFEPSAGIHNKAPLPKRSGRRDRSAAVSELSMQLKKQWEESIVINDEHYSEHILRLRKLRRGELVNVWDMNDSSALCEDEVRTSNECADIDLSSDVEHLTNSLCHDTSSTNLNSSAHANSIEGAVSLSNASGTMIALEQEDEVASSDSNRDEDDTTMQFTLDGTFIDQLQQLFGRSSLPCNQDVTPVVNLPISLARQIFYYVMESQQSLYETMMQEDEDLARRLQEQEVVSSSRNPEVPPLQEIMDMEMALRLYKADEVQWRSETKDDLATKLSKQLLCETFPNLENDVLMNVFQAHNNSFEQTFEVLMASTGRNDHEEVLTVMTPEARAAHEKLLMDKAMEESLKNMEQSQLHVHREHEEVTQDEAYADADFYRCEANRHYQLRKDCLQKAQNSYQRGLPAVASYYSQMAALHKKRVEDSNAHAASSLLLAHSVGQLTTTLDLHFLYVVEAVQVLNVFLDHHVRRLEETGRKKQIVFIITGRGLRSSGRRSRIRPAVEEQLKIRGLKFMALNPGFLEVVVSRNSALSTNLVHK